MKNLAPTTPTNNLPALKTVDESKPNEIEISNFEKALHKFPSYNNNNSINPRDSLTTKEASRVLNNPEATIRITTKAQAKLGYTQTSAVLSWNNISFESKNNIKLFPVSGFVKPNQMLCFIGGGDDSGIKEVFQILRNPFNNMNTKHTGKYGRGTAHGDILLNGLPPGKFYTRTVSFIPKTDNHLPTLKVNETLKFSAMMRSPAHIPSEHIDKSVKLVLGMYIYYFTLISRACVDKYFFLLFK